MIEKRSSLLSRVLPDSEQLYYQALNDALQKTYERLGKLQKGYTVNSPDNTWTKERLKYIIDTLAKELGVSTAKFKKAFSKELVDIILIDNKVATHEYELIANLGHIDDEPSPYSFYILSKKQIEKIVKTDTLVFSYLTASGKKYSSLSVTTALNSTTEWTLEQVKSIITAGAITGQSPDAIVRQLRPINSQARSKMRTVVRTLLADASNSADHETLKKNRKYFDYYQFTAVLDTRTSSLCRSLDGRRWKEIPELFAPPLHPNCRSKIVTSYYGQDAGTRAVVLPDGTVKIIDGNLTYKDAIKIYPQLNNKKLIDVDKYEKLMLS